VNRGEAQFQCPESEVFVAIWSVLIPTKVADRTHNASKTLPDEFSRGSPDAFGRDPHNMGGTEFDKICEVIR
jgi:hypothetical protein